MNATIICKKCGVGAPGEIHISRGKSYLRRSCRACRTKEAREWRHRTGYCKVYYAQNRERLSAKANKKRADNYEHVRILEKAYQARNKYKGKITRLGLSYPEFVNKWEEVKGVCYICGLNVPLELTSPDHVVPLISGGKNSMDNIMPVHRGCNAAKRNHSVEEVLSWRSQ